MHFSLFIYINKTKKIVTSFGNKNPKNMHFFKFSKMKYIIDAFTSKKESYQCMGIYVLILDIYIIKFFNIIIFYNKIIYDSFSSIKKQLFID